MKSLWTQAIEKVDCEEISRDFIHLTQFMSYGDNSVKDKLAIILEKCVDNENYKKTAILNLATLANDDARLRADLQYFADYKDPSPEYQKIKPIAEEIIREIRENPQFNC